MNASISEFVICVEAIIYLLLYNLHDCTFQIYLRYLSEIFKISDAKYCSPVKVKFSMC